MKPGPDGTLSLRDQARQISLSASDPREVWRLLRDWASKQPDPRAAMHPALFQVLRHAKDAGFISIAPELAQEAKRMEATMPQQAMDNLTRMLGEACSGHGFSFDKRSFSVLTPEGRALMPTSPNGPLPMLAFQPAPAMETPQLNATCPLVPVSSDLTQFVMARETIFRVSDRLHEGLTTLERATLMPGRDKMPVARPNTLEPSVLSFSRPFERPKEPAPYISMAPEAISQKLVQSVDGASVSPSVQNGPFLVQSWKANERKSDTRNDDFPSASPSMPQRPMKKKLVSSPLQPKTQIKALPVAAESDLKSSPSLLVTGRSPLATEPPALSQKIKEIKPRRKKRKKAINTEKAPKQKTRATEAGIGHDLVRSLSEKLKSHAAEHHEHGKHHVHHPGHPGHAKGHVHEAPAKEEERKAETKAKRKEQKKPKTRKRGKMEKRRRKAHREKKEKRKVKALLSKKRKKSRPRRSRR